MMEFISQYYPGAFIASLVMLFTPKWSLIGFIGLITWFLFVIVLAFFNNIII